MPDKFNELLLKQDIIELYNTGITPDYGYLMNGRFEKDMVKTLYPLKTLSGNPISWEASDTEYLFPVVSLEPKQAGSGDPSPENVRPISGYDSVTVNARGKNVVDVDDIPNATISSSGYYFGKLLPFKPYLGATFTLSANVTCLTESYTDGWKLDLGAGNINYKYDIYNRGDYGKKQGARISVTGTVLREAAGYKNLAFRCRVQTPTPGVKFEITNIMLEVNDTPTPYAPYQPGTTATITLPETVYGGSVDVVTGVGEKTWEILELNGTENWNNYTFDGKPGFYCPDLLGKAGENYTRAEGLCNMAMVYVYADSPYTASNYIWCGVNDRSLYWVGAANLLNTPTPSEFKSYLAAQSAAGTPVQVAYKLATPEPFQATGNQQLTSLLGYNTIYTNGESIKLNRKARRLEV